MNGRATPHARSVRLPSAGWRLLRDRRGPLWIAALGGGLLRLDENGLGGQTVIDRFAYDFGG